MHEYGRVPPPCFLVRAEQVALCPGGHGGDRTRMGSRTPAREAPDERRVGSERTDRSRTRAVQEDKGTKPGRRRTGPEPDLIVPLRLVELVVLHIAPKFNRWLDGLDDPRVETDRTECQTGTPNHSDALPGNIQA